MVWSQNQSHQHYRKPWSSCKSPLLFVGIIGEFRKEYIITTDNDRDGVAASIVIYFIIFPPTIDSETLLGRNWFVEFKQWGGFGSFLFAGFRIILWRYCQVDLLHIIVLKTYKKKPDNFISKTISIVSIPSNSLSINNDIEFCNIIGCEMDNLMRKLQVSFVSTHQQTATPYICVFSLQ